MTQTCHPISHAVAHHMTQGLVEAICDRPGQTKARREARATEVVHSLMAFQPRDAVEVMLAGMVVTHFHLISQAAHDAFDAQPGDLKPRTMPGIVALGRMMIGFVKELHTAKTRPLAGATEVAVVAEPEVMPERQVTQPPPAAPAAREAAVKPEPRPMPAAAPRRTGASMGAMRAVMTPPGGPMPVSAGTERPAGDSAPGGKADAEKVMLRAMQEMEAARDRSRAHPAAPGISSQAI